jgi:hypothetical protein
MATNPYYSLPAGGKGPVIVPGRYVTPDQSLDPAVPYNQSQQYASSAQPHGKSLEPAVTYGHHSESTKPQQERKCHDAFWAVLFYAHLGVLLYCTVAYLPTMIASIAEGVESDGGGGRYLLRFLQDEEYGDEADDDKGDSAEFTYDPNDLMAIVSFAAVMSLGISTIALAFMMSFAQALIKFALVGNIVLFSLVAILGLLVGALEITIAMLFMAAFMAYYAYQVWSRIPFAAANLVTAVSAVRANMGLAFYAYTSTLLIFGWSIWWTLATSATIYVTKGCDASGNCESEINGVVVFLFVLSYYWTVQVLQNVVHVTTAGTVGAWWYSPVEANGCCSKAVRDSWLRAVTVSFGSICFASLIVAIIQAIREMVHSL